MSCYCSHAKCGKCHQWKVGTKESWSYQQKANNRSCGTQLICDSCTKKLKEKGTTSRDDTLYSCEACKGRKGRKAFSNRLMIQFHRKNLDYKCVLICLHCEEREKELLKRLKMPKARKCTKKCKQDWPHLEGCQCYLVWYGYPVISYEDLRWLHFRDKNKKYH